MKADLAVKVGLPGLEPTEKVGRPELTSKPTRVLPPLWKLAEEAPSWVYELAHVPVVNLERPQIGVFGHHHGETHSSPQWYRMSRVTPA